MLFDFDLRNPSVADMLGRKPDHGIKSMLTGDVPPKIKCCACAAM